jgi:hypothetical protein
MFPFLLSFAILCGLIFIGGFTWLMTGSGRTRCRSSPEVGAEIMGQAVNSEASGDVNIPVAGRRFF